MQTFAAKIKALCRFAANAVARQTRQHNSYVLGLMLAFVALSAFVMLRPASAHEGEDHSSEAQGSATAVTSAASRASSATTVSVRTAERNLSTSVGEFNVRLRQSPSDPRTGEEVQFEVAVRERVEGGFGAGDLQPVEGARVTARVGRASGEQVVGGLEAHGDPALGGSGAVITIPKESQLLFSIRTAPVEERLLVSGLKATGTVRARPDARGIISPPVSGRITFNRNISVGAIVGRESGFVVFGAVAFGVAGAAVVGFVPS